MDDEELDILFAKAEADMAANKKVWVIFKAATRSHYRKARRLVKRLNKSRDYTQWAGLDVSSYHGWSGFRVRKSEILGFEFEED